MSATALLIHDDIATIAAAKRLLQRQGYDVVLATSVEDALIAYGHEAPSLLVLGTSIEGGRGENLLRELFQAGESPLPPVLLVGDAIAGFELPVVPIPLEGDFFLEKLASVRAGPRPVPPAPAVASRRLGAPTPTGAKNQATKPMHAPIPLLTQPPVPAPPHVRSVPSMLKRSASPGGPHTHGTVTPETLPALVASLAALGKGVHLVLTCPDVRRDVWLLGDSVLGAASSSPYESIVQRAHQDGLIDNEQVTHLRALVSMDASAAGEAMRERGLLQPREVVLLLQRHTESVAVAAFGEAQALYEWETAETIPPGAAAATRALPALLVDGLRKALSPEEAERIVGSVDVSVRLDIAAESLEGFEFSERERRLLEAAQVDSPLEGLLRQTGVPPDVAFRVLATGKALGLLTLRPLRNQAESQATLVKHAERLLSKWAESAEADYFSVLALPRDANREDVERAFLVLKGEFDPFRFAGHPDPSVRLTAQRLNELLVEATQALSDDRLREAYARNLSD
ncbi:MAG: hypothetical protein ACKVPX_12125 [Myxococcaceae bacterium]